MVQAVKPWIEIVRLKNALAAAGATILGGLIGAGAWDAGGRWLWLLRAGASAALGVAAANAFNDARDADADAARGLDRPICRGDLTVRQARVLAAALGLGSLVVVAGRQDLAYVVLLGIAVSYCYSWKLQYMAVAKNLTVAVMSAFTVLGGAIATVGRISTDVVLAAGPLFAYVAAYEVISDFDDVSIDQSKGASTWAMTRPMSARAFVVAALCATPGFYIVAAVDRHGTPPPGILIAMGFLCALCGLLVGLVARSSNPAEVDWRRSDHVGKLGWLLVFPILGSLV